MNPACNNSEPSIEGTTAAAADEQIQHIASLVVAAAPDDLPGLAAIHSALQSLAEDDGVSSLANRGVDLVTQVMLRESTDATAALAEVGKLLTEMQEVLDRSIIQQPAIAVQSPSSFGSGDAQLVGEFIGEATSHLDVAEMELLKLEKNPQDMDAVNAVFRSFHTIKGVAGFLNLVQIGELAHATENLLDMARHGQLVVCGPTCNVILEACDAMRALIRLLGDAIAAGTAVPTHSTLPNLITRLKAAATGEAAPQASAAPPAPAVEQRSGMDRRQSDRRGSDAPADASVKVSTERLDNLINMVGELVIAEAMVSQNVRETARRDHRLQRNLGQLGKITRELQDLSMAMRMVPIQSTFQKMTRVVRDVAQKAQKQVELAIVGGETELDRNVVDAIGDPLVHMIRNSVDHGLERPEDREKAGKPSTGRVELRAEHKAGNILIHISDDGRGLNKERIVRKAIEAGIVREGQELSEQEIYRLIFHAGLSTAEKVTDISGRGVGMDVVKRNIESLRGRIEIASTPGQGASFTIRLPLTLAVIDGLLVRVGSQRYILPITSVERSLRPAADQISTVQERGEMCLVRDSLMPLVRLHRLFDIVPGTHLPEQALVVIVRDNDRQCCLLVDELLGQQQVVIKSLGEGVGAVRGISGGAILGDGNVCLILDVPGLIDLSSI